MNVDLTQVLIALIGGLPATLAALGALVIGWKNAAKVDKQTENITKIEVATNSMKDALVKATRDKALLEGHADGVESEKSRAVAEGVATLIRNQAVVPPAPKG